MKWKLDTEELYKNLLLQFKMSKGMKASFNVTECAICQDRFQFKKQVIAQLDCKHIYHRDCIWEWISTKINKYYSERGVDSDQEEFTIECPLCNIPLIKMHEQPVDAAHIRIDVDDVD